MNNEKWVKITIRRQDGETWRECAARYGAKGGERSTVLSLFDSFIEEGSTESEAALFACYPNMACCDFELDDND